MDAVPLVAAEILMLDDVPGQLRATTTPAGEVLALEVEAAADVPPEGWTPALLRTDTTKPHRYLVYGPDGVVVTEPLTERFTDVQPLPEGRWLFVRGRARGPGDANAAVVGPDGRVLRRFAVGDAVAQVQADAAGRVWVGYYDEGVFGGEPPSDAGLAAFDADGRVAVRFNDLPDVIPIDSLYALNVASPQDVWLYYYSAFCLVHLRDGAVAGRWPDFPVKGAAAIAVHGGHALVAGGYGEEDKLWQVALAGPPRRREVRATASDGTPLVPGPAQARGPYLFFRDRGRLWRLCARDLPAFS